MGQGLDKTAVAKLGLKDSSFQGVACTCVAHLSRKGTYNKGQAIDRTVYSLHPIYPSYAGKVTFQQSL